jgi:hypothetical protein
MRVLYLSLVSKYYSSSQPFSGKIKIGSFWRSNPHTHEIWGAFRMHWGFDEIG